VIRPPILPDEVVGAGAAETADAAEAAVAALTRRYLEVIESEIRDHPEMWLWMHRRWSVGPRRPAPASP